MKHMAVAIIRYNRDNRVLLSQNINSSILVNVYHGH